MLIPCWNHCVPRRISTVRVRRASHLGSAGSRQRDEMCFQPSIHICKDPWKNKKWTKSRLLNKNQYIISLYIYSIIYIYVYSIHLYIHNINIYILPTLAGSSVGGFLSASQNLSSKRRSVSLGEDVLAVLGKYPKNKTTPGIIRYLVGGFNPTNPSEKS